MNEQAQEMYEDEGEGEGEGEVIPQRQEPQQARQSQARRCIAKVGRELSLVVVTIVSWS